MGGQKLKVKKWAEGQWDDVDVNTATINELLDLQEHVAQERNDISYQLDTYKNQQNLTGKNPDPQWYSKAKYALNKRRVKLIHIERAINLAIRTERDNKKWSEIFVGQAQLMLDKKIFDNIAAETDEVIEDAEYSALHEN